MVRPVEVEEVCVGVWVRGRGVRELMGGQTSGGGGGMCVCVCVMCEGGEGTHVLIVRPVEVEEICVERSLCMTRGREGGEVGSW